MSYKKDTILNYHHFQEIISNCTLYKLQRIVQVITEKTHFQIRWLVKALVLFMLQKNLEKTKWADMNQDKSVVQIAKFTSSGKEDPVHVVVLLSDQNHETPMVETS